MSVEIRLARPEDTRECGRICYEAFKGIAELRRFPLDFPSPEYADAVVAQLIESAGVFGVVAERDGRIVGSNFLDERDVVAGVGPISVDPAEHGGGVGRLLMEAVMERGADADSIRLLQDAHNPVSLSLYASLGFRLREPVALVSGTPRARPRGTLEVRPLEPGDLEGCAALCSDVHGYERTNGLRHSARFGPWVGVRDGDVRAYASSLTAWPLAHGVARNEEDMRELVLAAAAHGGTTLSVLVPMRDSPFFAWCLDEDLRTVKTMNLMSLGEYREPLGAWFPSVIY